MAWIESHQELLNHPKTLDLAARMKWNIDLTIGKLHRVWWWCMNYAPDGDLRRHSASQLAAAAGVPAAQAEKFVSAMIQCRWFDRSPYFRVHDWWEYAGPFLQRKHNRHPRVWQQIRDLYLGTSSESTIELDTSLCAAEKPPSDPNRIVQQNPPVPCCSSPTMQPAPGCITPEVEPGPCSIAPPDPTVPDPTSQTNHHHHRTSAAVAADRDDERPGRHQQISTHTQLPIEGIFADHAGPAESAHTPPIHAGPGNDLEQIIHDRIGHRMPLSRLDMERLIALRNKHGTRFYSACDLLHAGVTNASSYLQAILEQKDQTERLLAEVERIAQKERGMSIHVPGASHA